MYDSFVLSLLPLVPLSSCTNLKHFPLSNNRSLEKTGHGTSYWKQGISSVKKKSFDCPAFCQCPAWAIKKSIHSKGVLTEVQSRSVELDAAFLFGRRAFFERKRSLPTTCEGMSDWTNASNVSELKEERRVFTLLFFHHRTTFWCWNRLTIFKRINWSDSPPALAHTAAPLRLEDS